MNKNMKFTYMAFFINIYYIFEFETKGGIPHGLDNIRVCRYFASALSCR